MLNRSSFTYLPLDNLPHTAQLVKCTHKLKMLNSLLSSRPKYLVVK